MAERVEQLKTKKVPQPRVRIGGTWESFRIALESLRSNKLRTFLTMLGIIIGVWSVVSLLAIGNGAQQAIVSQVQDIGTNLLNIVPGQPDEGGPRTVAQALTLSDADALRRGVPEATYVAPLFQGSGTIVAGSVSRNVSVTGAPPDVAIIRDLDMDRGQFITEEQNDGARNVVVLGNQLASDIFGEDDPIGQPVRLNGQTMRVVGVLAESGGLANEDEVAYLPLNTAYRTLAGARATGTSSRPVSAVLMQIGNEKDIPTATAKAEQVMRRQHKLADDGEEDDFTVFSQAQLLTIFSTITTTLTVFLGAIAGISLLVGGIGVMNIMLVSVTERTKEIGLRKAVGAKRRDILRQFLVEALVMSILGGLIGLALGWLTATLVGFFFGQYIVPIVTLGAVLLAVGFSAAVGLFFGIYPAQRAARLNPIQALRYE